MQNYQIWKVYLLNPGKSFNMSFVLHGEKKNLTEIGSVTINSNKWEAMLLQDIT